jgi:hypothetical protein
MRTIFRQECDECRLFTFAGGWNDGKPDCIAAAAHRAANEFHRPFELSQNARKKRLFARAAFVIFRCNAGHGFVRL